MKIPNYLTILRIVLIPFFAINLINEKYILAVGIFLFAGITDILDGYIARKYNATSDFGKIADPIADKLMQSTALVVLVLENFIPTYVLTIVLVKESLMGLGTVFLYKKADFVVSSNIFGKVSAVIFYIAVVITIFIRFNLINPKYPDLIINSSFIIVIISTICAMVSYYYNYIYSGEEGRKKNSKK